MNTELHGIRREIRAGSVSDGKPKISIGHGRTRNLIRAGSVSDGKHRNTSATEKKLKKMYWPRTNTETKDLIRAGSVSDGKPKIGICQGQMVRKNPFPSFSRMRKSIFTARQEWTPAYARVTRARNKRGMKAFSPRRAQRKTRNPNLSAAS